jgi:hypothetical protein
MCRSDSPFLTGLVDRELAPEAQRSLHAHLRGCARCLAAARAEGLLKCAVAMLPRPRVPLELILRILGRVMFRRISWN